MTALLLFFLLNGLVFAGATLIARYALRIAGGLAVGLAAALIGWVCIVIGLEALGACGAIRLVPALCLASGVFATGVFFWRLNRHVAACDPASSDREGGAAPSHLGARIGAWLCGILALWAVTDVLVNGLLSPVLPVSDAPIYHLYFAVRWWKAGTLELAPTPFGESAAPYFPANGDVWLTWLLLPWSREHVAKVGQWPFLIVGMVAVYALARELGGRRELAVLPAALWGTSTHPLAQAGLADVDLVMAGWFLVGLWFLVRFARSSRVADLICCGLACGAAIGCKFVALLFVPCLALGAAVLTWRGPRRWTHLAILAVSVTLPCAYWFGRNACLTGNPLYPLHLEVLGRPILSGWYKRETLEASQYHMPTNERRYLGQLLLRGADPILLPAWLLGLASAFVALVRRRWLPALCVVLATLHIVLFWWVNPYQTQERFLFAAFGMLAVLVVQPLDRWPWLSLPFAVMLGWHLVVDQEVLPALTKRALGFELWFSPFPAPPPAPLSLSSRWLWTPVTVGRMVLLAAFGGAVLVLTCRRGPWSRGVGVAALALGLAGGGIAFRAKQSFMHDARLNFYPYWSETDYTDGWLQLEQLSGRGARVAYAGTNLPFYLFGIGLRNDVRYVNVTDHPEFRMHDYHRLFAQRGEPLATTPTPDWDRREPDEAAWLRNLREKRVDRLFVGFTNRAGGWHNFYDREGFTIERTWADRHDEVFRLVYANPSVRIYALQWPTR